VLNEIMEAVEEIKQKIDIVELISQYMELRRAGINYSARCPFHQEKTPSFMVSPERQVFRCFGCGESGDAISFLQKMEGLTFPEALKVLGDRVGVQVSFSNKKDYEKVKSEKEKLSGVNLLSAHFFKAALWNKAGAKALEYLYARGLTKEVIEKFKIGYAPASDQLETMLKKAGYSYKDLSSAGNPQRFHYRIMFPIFNVFGEVIGFSGRIMESVLPEGVSAHPKYLNTPETALFHKSKILYGLNLAKEQIRKSKKAIIVEGQMDVAMSHVAGVENVVASSGTALTDEHLKILGRYTPDIILSFDEDEAGQKAAEKAVTDAYDLSLEPKLTIIQDYKDVGELVKERPKQWQKVVDEALAPVEWIIKKKIVPGVELSGEEKKDLVKRALFFVRHMQDEIEKAHYVKRLAGVVGVPQISVEKALEKFSSGQKSKRQSPATPAADKPSAENDLEAKLVAAVLLLPQFVGKIKSLPELILEEKDYLAIYTKASACYNDPSKDSGKCLQAINQKIPRQMQEVFAVNAVVWDKMIQEDEQSALSELEALIGKILVRKRESIKDKFASLIAEAEKSGDINQVKELMTRLQQNL